MRAIRVQAYTRCDTESPSAPYIVNPAEVAYLCAADPGWTSMRVGSRAFLIQGSPESVAWAVFGHGWSEESA